jgi:hypothetical protein
MKSDRPPATKTLRRHPRAAALLALWLLGCPPQGAMANQGATGTNTSSASLDFVLNIGKFIFFRIGTGAIPAGGVAPVTGNGTAVAWSGAGPALSATGANTVLPVEVRSNAGPINIKAAATLPLSSGAHTIPLSQISVSSSDANLPAPPIPDTGTGAAVNVTGTAFSNLVTVRSANWTFSYTPLTSPIAGVYTGQISFTASSP